LLFENTFKLASLRRDSLKIQAVVEFCYRHIIAIAVIVVAMVLLSIQDLIFGAFEGAITLATDRVSWVGDCDHGSGG